VQYLLNLLLSKNLQNNSASCKNAKKQSHLGDEKNKKKNKKRNQPSQLKPPSKGFQQKP